jgi:NIMA (never in mitosis gene a)-related kinase
MEKYRKVKMVGKGNFGYALLVQNLQNRKFFIMKVIDVSKMDTKQRNDALNEVIVLKEMRHPYIVAYRESFMNKKCLCIVMDYADAGDLYTRIAQHKKNNTLFDENQILDWFVKIALAIKHIHDKRILHRDLKTQNIFLTSNGDVKVGDFGIARVLQNTYDCAQTAIGTPYYLSPEICQEKPYNQKSDIWSLGCIFYEMLTLRHAFDSNSIKGLVLKILKGTYPPIPSVYSDNVKNLVAEILIKDPAKRPSIRKILEKDFIKERIQKIFEEAMKKQESNNMSKLKQKPESKNEEDISQKTTDEHNFPFPSQPEKKDLFKKLIDVDKHELNV